MPQFSNVSVEEAQAKSATGKRSELLHEYMGYLEQLRPGGAGSLSVGPGETTQAVRRRLSAAAKATGKQLAIRRTADTIYFWVAEGNGRRRRGRPRKQA
jgi:hypothetical protein